MQTLSEISIYKGDSATFSVTLPTTGPSFAFSSDQFVAQARQHPDADPVFSVTQAGMSCTLGVLSIPMDTTSIAVGSYLLQVRAKKVATGERQVLANAPVNIVQPTAIL